MNRNHEPIERWTAAMAGSVLVAVPLAAWGYRGSLSWMDSIVALIGIAALVLWKREDAPPEEISGE